MKIKRYRDWSERNEGYSEIVLSGKILVVEANLEYDRWDWKLGACLRWDSRNGMATAVLSLGPITMSVRAYEPPATPSYRRVIDQLLREEEP